MKLTPDLQFPFVFEQPDAAFEKNAAAPDEDTIRSLQSQGNTSDDWNQLRIAPGAVLTGIRGCHFSGRCVLGSMVSLRHSTFHDVVIEDSVGVHNCSLIRGYRLSRHCVIEQARMSHEGESLFGNDLAIPPAVEMSPYQVRLCAGMGWDEAVAALRGVSDLSLHDEAVEHVTKRIGRTHAFAGPGCVVRGGAVVYSSYIGAGRIIEGPYRIEASTLLGSTAASVASCTGGGIIRSSILEADAWVGDFGRCERSMLFAGASVSRNGQVTDSVLGAHTGVAQGEVTASVLGPLVGVHHASLLIACMWPEGRGNVGSGAQVGSNHTSRLPDQSMVAGEGMFFGLATAVKFPANYRESPYSVIATGLITGPQTVRFPFSLLTLLDDTPSDAPDGYNRLIPGWMISHNFFALLRNELKFAKRLGRARGSTLVIREETAALVRDALARLEAVSETDRWYYDGSIPGVGKNVLLESDRKRGIAAYRDFLDYHALRTAIAARTPMSKEALAEGIDVLERLRGRTIDSRARDFHRGVRVFAEYRLTHPEPEDDPDLKAVLSVLSQEMAELHRLERA